MNQQPLAPTSAPEAVAAPAATAASGQEKELQNKVREAEELVAAATLNPGEIKTIDGKEYWIEPDGYTVEMKFVRKYPSLYGPLAVDPDKGYGNAECNDAGTQILNKLTGYGGLYSTWSERHCSLTALGIGINDVETSADVPPVPKFWAGEIQYWVDHIAIGRLIKKEKVAETASSTVMGLLQNTRVLAIITAALTAGGLAIPTLSGNILTLVKTVLTGAP